MSAISEIGHLADVDELWEERMCAYVHMCMCACVHLADVDELWEECRPMYMYMCVCICVCIYICTPR